MWTRAVRLGLVLSALISLPSCALLSVRKPKQQIRLDVVTTPGALDPCTLTVWLLPPELSADHAARLAIAARAEAAECAQRHRALIEDVRRHNEGKAND